jgi:hypothetical protein
MDIGHHEVIVSQARYSPTMDGAEVKGAELADRIAIAYFQPGRFSVVFFVLRVIAKRTKLENAIIAADACMTIDDDMWPDPGIIADFHVLADD